MNFIVQCRSIWTDCGATHNRQLAFRLVTEEERLKSQEPGNFYERQLQDSLVDVKTMAQACWSARHCL